MLEKKWLIAACVGFVILGLAVGVFTPDFLSSPPAERASTLESTAKVSDESRSAPDASTSPADFSTTSDTVTSVMEPADWDSALGKLPRWTDVTDRAGIDFRHTNGMRGKYEYLEVMGGGIAAFDYDSDGDLDLYFVNGNRIDQPPEPDVTNRLYRNEGNLTFRDVTAEAHVGDVGYGQGCAAADYDGDGDLDLYVTNYGPNVLYRNNGDGTFTDVSNAAGVADPGWGQSVSFVDVDQDGALDLYVQNYLKLGVTRGVEAFIYVGAERVPDYPSPLGFPGEVDRLYRNRGDGTFEDITKQAGLDAQQGKGMGLACVDLNGDEWVDIFVANDTMPNFLYRNNGSGQFTEVGRTAGVAYNLNGMPEASMGVDVADYDADGDLDLVVPCLARQFFTLYRNEGNYFSDVSSISGLAKGTAEATGFDAHFFDYDNDGDLDLFFTCGGVRRNEQAGLDADYNRQYGMRDLLLANDGTGRFINVTDRSGEYFQRALVGRGSVVADLDQDGDLDLVVSNLAERAVVLRNDTNENRAAENRWLTIRLVDRQGRENPDRTHVWLTTDTGLRQHWVTHPGTSYLSQSDRRPHFGLATAARITRLEINWPDGTQQVLENVKPNQFLTIQQPGPDQP